MTGRMRMGWALAVLALVLAARSARAQEGPDARMDAFLRFGRDYGASRELASFFPARGTLLWLLKTRTDDGARRGRWRFDAAELPRATDAATGPLCGSFSHGGDAIVAGALMEHILTTKGRWRRVGASRFVPRGASAASPVFVEWRHEDGRWVIAAFGDERDHRGAERWWSEVDPMVPDSVPAGLLELPLPMDAAYAPNTPWYQRNEPILVIGRPLVKYGYPRAIEAGSLRRIGAVQGVGVYVEREVRGRPGVVFVPVTPDGLFQPYQDSISTGCES